MAIKVIYSAGGKPALVEARYKASVLDVSKDRMRTMVAEAGSVLLRGFEPNLDEFAELVAKHSSRTTLDPARTFHAKDVQHVDSGTGPIGLHCENGTSPFPPELVWFFCATAARRGSQTTVCDGRQVWRHMSFPAKAFFTTHRLRFARNIAESHWKAYVAHEHPDTLAASEVTIEHLFDVIAESPNCSVEVNDDGSIHFQLVVEAAHPTKFSDEWAFANSLLGPSHNYEAPCITTESGDALPDWIMDEVVRKTEATTEDIAWQDGDVVMIDNTRVMHGRRPIADSNRALFIGLSMV